jgi:hypothetical protein
MRVCYKLLRIDTGVDCDPGPDCGDKEGFATKRGIWLFPYNSGILQ